MVSIGLTGNIASGKSHIAEIFASYGFAAQDSDKVVHQIISGAAKDIIEKEFGTSDRRALGQIVFSNISKLRKLEKILHPLVRKANIEFISQHPKSIIEIPLLFETKAEEIFDFIIFVDVNKSTQRKRAFDRGNMTEDKFNNIINQQEAIPILTKKQKSDFVIDNSLGSDTNKQINKIIKKICVK